MGDRGHQLVDVPTLGRADCYCVWFIETPVHTGVVDDFGFDSGRQFPRTERLHLSKQLVGQQHGLLADDLMLVLHLLNAVAVLGFPVDLAGRQNLAFEV